MNDREHYIETARSTLEQFDIRIAQATRHTGEQDLIDEIIKKREMMENEFQRLHQTALVSWDNVRTGFESSCRDMDHLLERLDKLDTSLSS